MNRIILAAALAAGCALASSSPAFAAAAKNYDCSKPGNANKAVCKGTAKATPAAAKPAPAAKPAAATKTTKTVTRSYDCTKAGNANKAQCKTSTSVATTTTKPAAKTAAAPAPAPSMFQRMKNAITGSSTPTPAAKPAAAPAPRRTASATPASVEDKNPAGAIAQCKDGTYSHAKQRTGACSRHGGVAKWS